MASVGTVDAVIDKMLQTGDGVMQNVDDWLDSVKWIVQQSADMGDREQVRGSVWVLARCVSATRRYATLGQLGTCSGRLLSLNIISVHTAPAMVVTEAQNV
ncbi:unnamed protein product [Ostreobium quekettii]|uniref:Uncharacterized protein n=1 Tax=Ostreobium quekettii TaxID=121088 RepID=A0A8S1JA54_9CHLO|nr:unnamed protein product [Ostreobium quekettii]